MVDMPVVKTAELVLERARVAREDLTPEETPGKLLPDIHPNLFSQGGSVSTWQKWIEPKCLYA